MAVLEPFRYEPEQTLEIPISSPRVKCFVVSGFADFSWAENIFDGPIGNGPHGSDLDDDTWKSWNVHLVVGPDFAEIFDISPTAGIAGYYFLDSDETDATGIELENCRWDTVGVGESNPGVERIRLKIKLRMCGGTKSMVTKISYHLVAVGRPPKT